ncbi:LuxR family transcriptional regulator [Pseudonocardia yunnanensis]|uniref:AAA family ATPase n=1 Tax=Pseudonocardia yunnanensis TaxID=58107 RepID=A0ABW4FAP0_9PSEU
MLRDRRSERDVFDRLLAAVRAGESRSLVVRGEPGVGKTALLEYVTERATGCRVERVTGVQSEMELAFAGLHQLCAPVLGRVERLPVHQRDALCRAIGMTGGPAPDRFLVGLALLGLLAEVAQEQPLVCLVDDAQWFDQASVQALTFAARRLSAESVALVFAARASDDVAELTGLPELTVTGLPADDARELLRSALPGPVDEQVLDRIVAETQGNPLALLEVSRGFTSTLAGSFGLPDGSALPVRLEESYRRQLALLPSGTRGLLLVAAAEPVGDPVLVWRAAERLGIGGEAAAPAAEAGLVEIDARVRFRHPLVRSAVYRAASPEDRQGAHRALAAATDPEVDPDRRAWHAAQAACEPVEDVAAELERLAHRAQGRGGVAAAAAFLERATHLTSDSARRSVRALAAAQAKLEAGAPGAASGLLATAEMGSLDELQRARLERMRAQIAFARNRGSDAPPLLLDAAVRLSPLDARQARETYLEALAAAVYAGRTNSGRGVTEVAEAALAAPPPSSPPRPLDLLLDGLAMRYAEGYAAGLPMLRRALHAFRHDREHDEENGRWLWLACLVAQDICDDETWHALATQQVRVARGVGALKVLPIALTYRAAVHVQAGELTAASTLIEESDSITAATGICSLRSSSLMLAAWRGREAQTVELIEAGVQHATRRGEGRGITLCEYVTAVLHNGLGRYPAALVAAQQACAHDDLGLLSWALSELVEAGVRSGRSELAADALRRLCERTRASGTEWALGIEARSCALLSDGRDADNLYQDAIDRLARCRITVQLARANLVYGEWLRRKGRRADARERLRTAHELFTEMEIEAFAQRAARELSATGEQPRSAADPVNSLLTGQERQIAQLAGKGLSNPEIGARLFISPRTVEWHLHKIFAKLNVTSRKQLRG